MLVSLKSQQCQTGLGLENSKVVKYRGNGQSAKYNTNRKNTDMYTETINYHYFMLNN